MNSHSTGILNYSKHILIQSWALVHDENISFSVDIFFCLRNTNPIVFSNVFVGEGDSDKCLVMIVFLKSHESMSAAMVLCLRICLTA